ncbi:methyl-accepting chemotaxis protein [Aquabacterium soli]|uniref:methyl-accepting chemotaxis protein n=1 Tax=Aquabacterium soli TaxID=2493092 RepID=UPI0013156998|nr:methyl-accepting chemotaxis protein [Aquabacterium soli]
MAAVIDALDHTLPQRAGVDTTTLARRAMPRKTLQGLSLNAKICLAASACTIASLLITGVAVGLQSSSAAEESAKQSVRATGQYAASQVQSDLQSTFKAIGALASALQVARSADNPPPRDQLDATLKRLLEQHSPWLASYSLWEPNALDGKDAEHVSKGPQDDATGRFISYWNRGSGDIKVEPLLDYEKAGANDWYDIPRRTGKTTLVEPYLYKVGGKDVLITSLVTPIQVGGKFVGIVGVDYLLDGLQKALAEVKSLDGAEVQLISAGGKYVSHPDAKKIGADAADLSPEALDAVRQGKTYEYTDNTGHVRVLTPVRPDADAQPWALCIHYTEAAAQAPARAMMALVAGIALVCALLAVGALLAVVTTLTRPVRELATTMDALAGGQSNLRVELPVRGSDELAHISRSFNQFVGKLRGAFEDVRSTSGAVDGAAGEISVGNADLSARTEQQASNLEEISASMVQLSQGVQSSAQTSRQADTLSRQAAETAQRSQSVMQDAITAMEEVGTSSKRIADITAVIDGIAFQTNILALNAAVEAARAGEQGRGFAVVASEVRTLAQRAGTAAKDIKSLIGESSARVEVGTERIKVSGSALAELVTLVGDVSGLINTISHSSVEQAQGIAHVEVAIGQLDSMTQQNAALVEEAAAAAASLKQQTQRMTGTLAEFI